MLIDTHAHLYSMIHAKPQITLTAQDYIQIQTIVTEAAQEGVTQLITVGTTRNDSIQCYEIAQKFPTVYATVGIHPTDATDTWADEVKNFDKLLSMVEPGYIVGIGECGIDLYHKGVALERQKDLFRAQIELALKHELPLIIHSRDAADETFRLLGDYVSDGIQGIIHCFSYDYLVALDAIASGFVIGIGGAVTYPKNDTLRAAVVQLPLHKLVLETDSPFLPPQPWRGQPNHPKHIKFIAEYVAQLKHTTLEAVATITSKTASELLGLRA